MSFHHAFPRSVVMRPVREVGWTSSPVDMRFTPGKLETFSGCGDVLLVMDTSAS